MKTIVAILLSGLLLLHTLAVTFVWNVYQWQQEKTLAHDLTMYRSTDSLVEFNVALPNSPDQASRPAITDRGFSYRSAYYEPIRLEVHDKALVLLCLETKNARFGDPGLLSFLEDYLTDWDYATHKTRKLIKLIISEYSPPERQSLRVLCYECSQQPDFDDVRIVVPQSSSSIHAPPPNNGLLLS